MVTYDSSKQGASPGINVPNEACAADSDPLSRAESTNNSTSPGQRRKRSVYGSYCDIDSVTEGPSHDFSNWIAISKQKLKV